MRHVTTRVRTPLRDVEAHYDIFVHEGLDNKSRVKAGLCVDTIGVQAHIDSSITSLRGHVSHQHVRIRTKRT